ncbi:MAG: hypothetical protein V3U58_01625 [Thermodesulfobacteriota bacterium]
MMNQLPPLKPFKRFEEGRLRSEFDPEAEELRGYYDNGELWAVYPCKNSVPHGLAKIYREDGTLDQEVTFKNGRVDGPARGYYPTGEIFITEMYCNNNLIVITAFDKEGRVMMSLSEN